MPHYFGGHRQQCFNPDLDAAGKPARRPHDPPHFAPPFLRTELRNHHGRRPGPLAGPDRGEDVIKACSSFDIVSRMREGRSPQEACEDALRRIDESYAAVGIAFRPGEKFVAINRDGEFGCAWNISEGSPAMSVMDAAGYRRYEGVNTVG